MVLVVEHSSSEQDVITISVVCGLSVVFTVESDLVLDGMSDFRVVEIDDPEVDTSVVEEIDGFASVVEAGGVV